MIGTIIDGCYRVDSLVGEGGYGKVYKCTDLELKRAVAVKMLKPGSTGDRDLSRFLGEARHLASLSHPHVVQIYRLGNHAGAPYIAMEFIRGRNLGIFVQALIPAPRRVLEIMHEVAGGLAAIHAMGILHRDLSPNNIMVTDNGVAKILDLGLSRVLTATSADPSRDYVEGTLRYLSPEHLNKSECGVPSEIFSFGLILYEALTRVHPFYAEHSKSVFYKITQQEPEPLRTHMADCPARLDRLLAACLAKPPEDRPATMAEVERELGEVMRLPEWSSVSTTRPIPAAWSHHRTPENPYGNRIMIRRRRDFFGRAQEITRIFARLNATPPGSMSVVGDRKIGKSSLLNHVYTRSVRQQNLKQPDMTVMVFLDFQQAVQMSVEAFVRELLGMANLELRGRLDVSDCALSLDGIKDLVERLDGAGFRLTILLDEFEAVTANPNFNLEFFAFLRFLANHYNVSYITSSARDLQVLCHDKEISHSPFFNIFSTVRLSVFDRKDAEELIRKPSEEAGKPLGAYVDRILTMAGLFPFFIQMACSHAIDYMNDHPDTSEPEFHQVRRHFYEEAKLHYRYIWDGFDTHEQSTVLRVARGKGIPDSLKHVLEELEARHYLLVDAGRPRLFASTFDEFVKHEGRDGGGSMMSRIFGWKSR